VVAAELASRYIDEQTKGTVNAGTSAKQFIEEQVRTAKEELDTIDNQRLAYLQQNMNNLPSQSQALVGRLTGLHEEQKALIAEQGRQRDLGAAYRSQLADITKSYEQEIALSAENTTDPKTTMAWDELVRRRSEYDGELQSLLTQYKEKHQDVIAKRKQLEDIKAQQDQMIAEWKARTEEQKQILIQLSDPRILSLKTQIAMMDSDVERQQKLLSETNSQIADLDGRINAIPNAEVGIEALDHEYQTKKANYDQLLVQQQKINLGANVENLTLTGAGARTRLSASAIDRSERRRQQFDHSNGDSTDSSTRPPRPQLCQNSPQVSMTSFMPSVDRGMIGVCEPGKSNAPHVADLLHDHRPRPSESKRLSSCFSGTPPGGAGRRCWPGQPFGDAIACATVTVANRLS
jgi:predicted  nucleic acid-binding Zn-ribbon protein